MEMASSVSVSAVDGGTTATTTNTLPSLFGDHHRHHHTINTSADGVAETVVLGSDGKDLEGLIDSALSRQIEFILQDAPMTEDDEDDDEGLGDHEVTANHIESPPTKIITSASIYNRHATNDVIHQATHRERILNGRRIIIQSTEEARLIEQDHEEEDPELNDENLQDIEEEAQAAEADEEPPQLQAHVKLEQEDLEDMEAESMEFIASPGITQHATLSGQPPQLVLPAGSIVSTSARTLAVPVSEALVQLQRRPVYISNTMSGMAGATFVRMPAVISRGQGMTVLNVVQQGMPVGGPTTQLILQAAPASSTGAAAATPVVVTSSTASVSSGHAPAEVAVATPSIVTAAAAPSSAVAMPVVTGGGAASTSVSAISTANNITHITTYQCEECVEKFESKELFDIHRSGHANNMKCAICNMVLKSLKNYEKHCLRCKPYECQICGRVVRFRPNFIKHMRVHTGQQSERHKYKCDVCHKEFMSFEYFKVHKKIHNENVNLTCEICGKVFSALASLRGHSKLHSGVKLHKCDVCGKGFGQRYNLKIHARTHTGDFPFECKICKKKLHTQSSLQTHMQVHQRDQTSQVTTTIKYESATSNNSTPSTSGRSNAASSTSTVLKTVVKLEPEDRPSTSGLQHHQQQLHQQHDDMDENSGMSDSMHDSHIVTTTTTTNAGRSIHATTTEDSSNESSNASHELQQLHQKQQILVATPTRSIVIKNYMPNDQNLNSTAVIAQHQTQVIQGAGTSSISSSSCGSNNSSTLHQQLLRKTPIIHSTGGVSSLSPALTSVVHQTGSPSPSPSSSSTSCSSSVVVSKTGAPLSLASAAIGTSTIRSTRNHHSITSNHQRALHRNNHRNHHRRRHLADLDDDDDDDDDAHLRPSNGRHFDDDDDDEKSSPSLATTAIIKVEPNLYSSGSGDNSNEMLIKEEVMFEDSAAPHSPHSPPSSKFRMSNFDSDLVDPHVDLNHSLPPYGNLFEAHSIQDSIPVQLYPDDDDDFRLDHSSLGGLHNTSNSTTDGDFIKKEWVYGAGSSYNMNGKFDDDSDALCDAANFIYN